MTQSFSAKFLALVGAATALAVLLDLPAKSHGIAHGGICCWQGNGFQVVGTLPGALRHRQLGYVDAVVMVQTLVEGASP